MHARLSHADLECRKSAQETFVSFYLCLHVCVLLLLLLLASLHLRGWWAGKHFDWQIIFQAADVFLSPAIFFLKNRKAEQSWNSRSTCLNVSSFSSLCSTWDGERLSTMLLPAGRTLLLFLLPSLTASSCSPDRLLLWRTTIATHRNKEFCA